MARFNIFPVKVPIERGEWTKSTMSGIEYWFVLTGFFQMRTTLIGTLVTSVHIMAVVGLYQLVTCQQWTLMFVMAFYYNMGGIGATVGSHRLWTHRSFKATYPLRLFLMIAQSSAGIWGIRTWCITHTVHHKYSDTDADQHNAQRGICFSHGMSLYLKQHPLNRIKEDEIDDSVIMSDTLVRFQHENYELLFLFFGMIVPTITGMCFGGTLFNSFTICYAIKHFMGMHYTALINSAAHVFGSKAYNPNILPGDNKMLSFFSHGEGYHNYHHQFPQVIANLNIV